MVFDPIQMHGIIRYANRNRIKNEDLAQHSFSVAYYVFKIAYDFNICDKIRNEAIAMAIIHDIGECFTSDLPHDVKYKNPELKQLCDKLERKYIDQLFECKDLWHKLEDNGDTIQKVMVKLGDSMSVKSYANREIKLGNNTDEMKEIFDNSNERVKLYINKLKEILQTTDGWENYDKI